GGGVLLHGANGSLSFACLSTAPAPLRAASAPSLCGVVPDDAHYYIVDEAPEPGAVASSVRTRRRLGANGAPNAMDGSGWLGGAAFARRLLKEEDMEAQSTGSHKAKSSAVPIVRVDRASVDMEKCDLGSPTRTTPLDESHTPKNLKIYTGSLAKVLSATDLSRELHDSSRPTVGKSGAASLIPESRVLVLYTGGTIGMKSQGGVYSPQSGYLPEVIRTIPPLNDRQFIDEFYANASVTPYSLPPIRNMKKRVIYWIVEYEPLLDSCDMTFDDWIRIASDIRKAYHHYDGFVVLHGTDTLAYTASALSFMMDNLGKPVVITGSQIPVAEVRSDGMDNLIGALVTAGNLDIPEVCVYFNNKLLRGNRTVKTDNSALSAFDSPNMLPLARMNINIKVNYDSIFRSERVAPFCVHDNLCRNVGMLRIFPSMSIESVRAFLAPPTQGVILQTFGAGNMPSKRVDILDALKEAIDRGVLVVNITQCLKGQVDMHYATGKVLYDIGVVPGSDMTSEAAMAKLCYVLGRNDCDHEKKKRLLQTSLRGEMTVTRKGEAKQIDIIPQIAKALRLGTTKEILAVKGALIPPLVCHAAKMNNIDLLEELKESGAVFSLTDYSSRNALHVSASNGNTEATKFLLQNGVNVHAKDQWGFTPLMCAVRSGSMECIEAIRQAGGVIDGDHEEDGMELCYAASHGDMKTLRAYAAAGCNLNDTDYDGRSALHVAVTHRRPDAITFLLESGAQPDLKDFFGRAPLDEASHMGWADVVAQLKQATIEWQEKERRNCQSEDEHGLFQLDEDH
ncbi:hypothetical protein PFISCL1PPCAC_3519, partial [Pristionchus fissidentatus]